MPVPDILLELAHRPAAGGLTVPWISPRDPAGGYRFGVNDPGLRDLALALRCCQLCGKPLGRRIVLLLRAVTPPVAGAGERVWRTAEPGSHPWCSAYAQRACPHLRRHTLPGQRWFAAWARSFDIVEHPQGPVLLREHHLIRLRPLTAHHRAGNDG